MDELSLSDYLAILRRWRKVFFISFVALVLLSAFFALSWSTYRSIATVQVEQPQVSSTATAPLGAFERNGAEILADRRISLLQQKVLSTGSLVEIISKFNLYENERRSTPIATLAERMRKKIKVELVGSAFANASLANKQQLSAIAFNLSFDYKSPLLTQQVTDELVTRFLNEDLKTRHDEARQTLAFLDGQIKEMETSLSDQEKLIADYQKEHGVSRPESLAFNQQVAESLMLNMQNLNTQIMTTEGSLAASRTQLASIDPYSRVISDGQVLTSPSIQLKALQTQYATLSAQYGPEHPDVVKLKRQIEALQPKTGVSGKETGRLKAQITDVRTNLEAAEKTYGPEHPDVVALRQQLHGLEDRLATRKVGVAHDRKGSLSDADNPVYLQVVAQIQTAEKQHEALLQQRKELQAQQEQYQKAIIENPEAVQKMAELTRDYDNAQVRYRELKAKKMAAEADEKLLEGRVGERLSLINPPELPMGTHPARLLILIAGMIFSAMGGFVMVIISQILSQSVVGGKHLETLVGVAPLVSIPHVYSGEGRDLPWGVYLRRRVKGLRSRLEKVQS